MIYGIGVDIVENVRIQHAVERWGKRFLERVFTEAEIAYAFKKADPYDALSVRFAAKEAFIKALSSQEAVVLTDIEISNQENGKPHIEIRGMTGETMKKKTVHKIHVSLSHEKEFSVACVVIEGIP